MDKVAELRDIIYSAEVEHRVVMSKEIYWIGLIEDFEMQKVLYDMMKDAVSRKVCDCAALWYIRDSIRRKYKNFQ